MRGACTPPWAKRYRLLLRNCAPRKRKIRVVCVEVGGYLTIERSRYQQQLWRATTLAGVRERLVEEPLSGVACLAARHRSPSCCDSADITHGYLFTCLVVCCSTYTAALRVFPVAHLSVCQYSSYVQEERQPRILLPGVKSGYCVRVASNTYKICGAL